MSAHANAFNNAADNQGVRLVPRQSTSEQTVTKLCIEIDEVDHLGKVSSLISGKVVSVESTNTPLVKKTFKDKYVRIEANLPGEKIATMRELTLEAVKFDNIFNEVPSGQLENLTLKSATIMVGAVIPRHDGRTQISGSVHYLDPRFNSLAAMTVEDHEIQILTHIPKEMITPGRALMLEKLEVQFSRITGMLNAVDPRPSHVVPGHPDYTKTLADATKATAMSTVTADKKYAPEEESEEDKTRKALERAANTPTAP